MFASYRFIITAATAIVVISSCSAQFHGGDGRAINTTGAWAKYNLIVKPTATTPNVKTDLTTVIPNLTTIVPVADPDPRYKASVLKTKYNHKNEFDRPFINAQNIHIQPLSEELDHEYGQNHQTDVEPEDDEDDDEDEDEEDETLSSEEQDAELIRSTTTQRSQSIHHKAPVKIAVIATSTPKTLNKIQLKKKTGNKGGLFKPTHHPTQHPQEVIVNVNTGGDDESHESVGDQKGHKHKGVKKYKIKGLKKLRKYMLPLLLAYKLKFFTLVPLLLGGLVLIVASTGFAGFFFALFAVGVGLKKD